MKTTFRANERGKWGGHTPARSQLIKNEPEGGLAKKTRKHGKKGSAPEHIPSVQVCTIIDMAADEKKG